MVELYRVEREYEQLWGAERDRAPSASPPPKRPPPSGSSEPGRSVTYSERVVRDSEVTRWVKDVHQHHCQACGKRFDSPRGPVAEAAHIRPLGGKHAGEDTVENVLCLCPNHHALFDRGAFWIGPDGRIGSDHVADLLEEVRMTPPHEPGRQFIDYHRKKIARRLKV